MKLKKILIIGIITISSIGLVGCHEVGDTIYDRFEIINVISEDNFLYEVRDKEEGVHYFVERGSGVFSPVYTKDKTVKVTEPNQKYIEKTTNEDKEEAK